MKIGIGQLPGTPVPLPIEIIEDIVAYIGQEEHDKARQRNLWSLCLISREWYSVTVKHLYRCPLLGVRNFDLFARTICPPVNSRGRAIGLEDLVTELHLGDLAYVTSSSMTARLLRRTKRSLVTFVSPSHSMSTSSLAPISKLMSLEHLDLSRDKYDFDIYAIMRAVRPLATLRFLSLPRGALSTYPDLHPSQRLVWPSNLEYLEANNTTPYYPNQWRNLLNDLPRSLRTLSFQHLRRDSAMAGISGLYAEAPQIASLIVEADEGVDCIQDDELSLYSLLRIFPGLVQLSLPESVLHYDAFFAFEEESLGSRLQVLTFHPVYAPFTSGRFELDFFFLRMVQILRQLQRVELSMDCAFGNEAVLTACSSVLAQRWPLEPAAEKGIFNIRRSGPVTQWIDVK